MYVTGLLDLEVKVQWLTLGPYHFLEIVLSFLSLSWFLKCVCVCVCVCVCMRVCVWGGGGGGRGLGETE